MKRILSTALAIFLALILISCTQNSNSSLSTGAGGATDGFVKPERYTSVLLITINPQFRLYLDENGTVRTKRTIVFSLTVDHRVVDGYTGAQFLASLADVLSDKEKLLCALEA